MMKVKKRRNWYRSLVTLQTLKFKDYCLLGKARSNCYNTLNSFEILYNIIVDVNETSLISVETNTVEVVKRKVTKKELKPLCDIGIGIDYTLTSLLYP